MHDAMKFIFMLYKHRNSQNKVAKEASKKINLGTKLLNLFGYTKKKVLRTWPNT